VILLKLYLIKKIFNLSCSYLFIRILDLQKDRYFETLSGKYWNSSAKGDCPNNDDSEGITLESLGECCKIFCCIVMKINYRRLKKVMFERLVII